LPSLQTDPQTGPKAAASMLPALRALAPARVNLLGEHTDYTGGLVLPMAIPFFTEAAVTPTQDASYTFSSALFPQTRTLALDMEPTPAGDWTDYPVGVLLELRRRGIVPPAFALHLTGNVPFGAGLSSSASVEVAIAFALLALAGRSLPAAEIALLCRAAENDFVHSPCGIMDQFAITAARAGHALLLHTRDLTTEHLPLNRGELAHAQVVVCNSMVRHSVATGDYGLRRREAEQGQAALLDRFPPPRDLPLRDLGDATLEQLEAARADMPHTAYLRCRHIVGENARVLLARQALLAGDPVAFGRLMLLSHSSQRDDFQCSCPEVDFLVETAASLPGCFGARLTGGGFGGCTVNLVHREHAARFVTDLTAAYRERFHIAAETYLCDPVDGALTRSQLTTP